MWGNRSAPVRHQQLLLNYCFGHSNISVVLCPYGMVSGLINHSPTEANAKVEWNYKLMKNPEWLLQPIESWQKAIHVGLMFNFVATRDILPGEEVLIDYGAEWDEAWNRHVANWTPPKGSSNYMASYDLNENPDLIVRTVAEGSYSTSQVEMYCLEIFRVWSGLNPIRAEKHQRQADDRYL